MKNHTLYAALMSVGLLMAGSAFAQTAPAEKQHAQEGAPAASERCGFAANANPGADPDCKQRTQTLTPSPLQGDAAAKK